MAGKRLRYLVLVLAALGCDGGGENVACADDEGCGPTEACVERRCVPRPEQRADARPDAALADAALADAARPDAALPDGAPLDAPAPDLPADATPPDAAPPDGARPVVEPGRVPEGRFLRGGAEGDQAPLREVWLSAYRIDVREVTVAEYRACVDADACPGPLPGLFCNWFGGAAREGHPMNCVDHPRAAAYCESVGGALPTEAQWEKAARGGCERRGEATCELGVDDVPWPWGGAAPDCAVAWTLDCQEASPGTREAGVGGASVYLVRDLVGNVAEWTADCYDAAAYVADEERDPAHPGDVACEARVVRGGGFEGAATRVNDRAFRDPSSAFNDVGFRCVHGG